MNRKLHIVAVLAAVLLAVTVVVGGCGNGNDANDSAQDQVFEMNWAGAYVEAHPTTENAYHPWIDEMAEKSDGRLVIHHFAPDTLCPESDGYDSTVSGAVDMGGVYLGLTPGKFPVAEFMDLPLISTNSECASMVIWDMYEKYPELQEQFKDVKVLWAWTSAPYQIHTVKKEVQTLEDLKGLKIIAWATQTADILKLLGAHPMEVSPLDTYLALERGMADGVACPLAPLRSFKISDVAMHHAVVDIAVSPFFNVINVDRWNALPEDLQNLLEETTGSKMAHIAGVSLDEGAAVDTKWLEENGHTVYYVPPEEKEKWVEAVSPMYDKWVQKMESKGITNAQDMIDDAVELGKKYAAQFGEDGA